MPPDYELQLEVYKKTILSESFYGARYSSNIMIWIESVQSHQYIKSIKYRTSSKKVKGINTAHL